MQRQPANILCVDVGRGTQDVIFFRGEPNLENCTAFVVPSRTAVLSERLSTCVQCGSTPLFTGRNMGGFRPWSICSEHMKKGGMIYASVESAKTFHDDPAYVEARGITILKSTDSLENIRTRRDVVEIKTEDVVFENFRNALNTFDVLSPIENVAVAVQDHGEVSAGQSNRVFRFQNYKKILKTGPNILDFAYWADEIPAHLTRMKSVAESLPKALPLLVMDTGIAAIMGCLEDPVVSKARRKIILNVGNGHTVAAYLLGEKIIGYFEHHTNSLDDAKIRALLKRFADGTLTFEDVFEDGGHGAYTSSDLESLSGSDYLLAVTGPNRNILKPGDGVYFSSPHGNMMLSGSYGLLRAFLERSANA